MDEEKKREWVGLKGGRQVGKEKAVFDGKGNDKGESKEEKRRKKKKKRKNTPPA